MKHIVLATTLTLIATSSQAEIVAEYLDTRSPTDSYMVILSDQKGVPNPSCPEYPASRLVQIHGQTASRGRFFLMAGCWYLNKADEVIIHGSTYTAEEPLSMVYDASLFHSSRDWKSLVKSSEEGSQSDQAAMLIEQEKVVGAKCRMNASSEDSAMTPCDEQKQLLVWIETLGWCHNHMNKWVKCSTLDR